MVEIAKHKFPNKRFIHGDIENIVLKDTLFTTLLAIGICEFIEDLD
jgi:ubiquinone/menaquinone biosynthesis C-methylase UbiE